MSGEVVWLDYGVRWTLRIFDSVGATYVKWSVEKDRDEKEENLPTYLCVRGLCSRSETEKRKQHGRSFYVGKVDTGGLTWSL